MTLNDFFDLHKDANSVVPLMGTRFREAENRKSDGKCECVPVGLFTPFLAFSKLKEHST